MKIAILGTGQLARMLALEGYRLGVDTVVLGPEDAPCAAAVTEHRRVALSDVAEVQRACGDVDRVTFELEHIPISTVQALTEQTVVRPNVDSLAISQDRLREKELFQRLGVATAAFAAVDSLEDLLRAGDELAYPLLVKTRRNGFDGRGQRWIDNPGEAHRFAEESSLAACLAERRVPFVRELSLLAARGADGTVVRYPLVQNTHRENILLYSRAPAPEGASNTGKATSLSQAGPLQEEACEIMNAVLEALDYVGLLALELFEVEGRLVANEMAPRVHNSGHWTLEGAATSQFENHLRAVAGWPLGATNARGVSWMGNLIGEMPDLNELLSMPGARVHLYGKEPRPKRKLGHVTVVTNGHEDADALDLSWQQSVHGRTDGSRNG